MIEWWFNARVDARQRPEQARVDASQRREQICAVAVEVIASRGLAQTRLADVAERAGVTPGLVLYYFRSKERLLSEALLYADDRFHLHSFHELLRLPSARDQLVRIVELAGFPAEQAEASYWTLWMELWVRALHDGDAARQRAALDQRWRAMLAGIVRSGQHGGEFGAVDVEDFVATLAALIDGLAIQVLLGDPSTDAERMRRLCLAFAAGALSFELPGMVGEDGHGGVAPVGGDDAAARMGTGAAQVNPVDRRTGTEPAVPHVLG
jgi:AcrR family transcriptional regulator